MLKCDILDVREWVFDLVTGRIVVDVVGQTRFIRGIENDKVHGILSNSAPGANAQRLAGKVMDDYYKVRNRNHPGATNLLTDFAWIGRLCIHQRSIAVRIHRSWAATEEISGQWLPRFHSLNHEVLAHRLWDGITVLARFNTLLGKHFDLRTPKDQ